MGAPLPPLGCGGGNVRVCVLRTVVFCFGKDRAGGGVRKVEGYATVPKYLCAQAPVSNFGSHNAEAHVTHAKNKELTSICARSRRELASGKHRRPTRRNSVFFLLDLYCMCMGSTTSPTKRDAS
eukprot:gene19490-biopygen5504